MIHSSKKVRLKGFNVEAKQKEDLEVEFINKTQMGTVIRHPKRGLIIVHSRLIKEI